MHIVSDRADVPAFFARYQPMIDVALRAELVGYASDIQTTHRYHMGWADKNGTDLVATQGKRLRPTMVLLGADAVGGEIRSVLPVAIALEYVHNFSLIHDDIEDRDRFRHHRPTLWVVWGDETAIVSGNWMLKLADRSTRALHGIGISQDKSLMAQNQIAQAYLRMIEGQYMDIAFEERTSVSVNEYLSMIERKTGALIETSLYLGALVAQNGNSNGRMLDGLRRAGYEFGRLFQIRDDILGVWGSDETGKPVCGDILNKKKSLPAIHALNSVCEPAVDELRKIYSKSELDDDDVQAVLEIMDEAGTYEFCDSMSEKHRAVASEIIDGLELDEGIRKDFFDLGDFLVARSS